MQCFGSFLQSVLHLNRCHASQPIGGVSASPLFRASQPRNEEMARTVNTISSQLITLKCEWQSILSCCKHAEGQNVSEMKHDVETIIHTSLDESVLSEPGGKG